MSSQELADELLQAWQALWALPPAERMERIEDARFQLMMNKVDFEMAREDCDV
ncbi:hypothetical protein [Bradyrhizobium sp. Leo121]|uniref:hypothetical protein n=1 Tax=Bradyrhizobium sp. Leo121 TaxID=1571195 RepID=UPI0013EEF892|nr:hypothetical protein [Bradyrhizobium sp. Leo121]